MDGIKVSYNKVSELMEYVGPCYDYKSWMHIVQYKKVCIGMPSQKIIYNNKTIIKVKVWLYTLMEGQKQQGILWVL